MRQPVWPSPRGGIRVLARLRERPSAILRLTRYRTPRSGAERGLAMFAPMRGASKEIAGCQPVKFDGNYAPRLMPIMERLPPSS